MPQASHSNDELSLRHLPDVSDSSFSFQIPGAIRGDNLLDDDDLDFFKGAEVSIAPIAPSPTITEVEPLFILAPKPEKLPPSPKKNERKMNSRPILSYDRSEDHDTNPERNLHQLSKVTTANVSVLSKPESKVITSTAAQLPSFEGSPAAVRLDNIRAELNLFSDNFFASPSKNVDRQELPAEIRHKPKGILKKSLEKKQLQQIYSRNNNNQKVMTEGGEVLKPRCATKLTSITCLPDGADTSPIQQEQKIAISDPEQVNGDHSLPDSSMDSALGGVASRLVMYSQKLISSFGSNRSSGSNNVCISQNREAGTDVDIIQGQAPHETDSPLTLSQLSPQKAVPSREPTPTPPDTVPMSPMRFPSKRPTSVASNVPQKRQKSQTNASSAEVSVPKPTVARLPATKRHPKPISNSSSESRLNRSRKRNSTSTRVNGAVIKRPPVFKPEGRKLIMNEAGDKSRDMRIVGSASSSECATSASTSRPENSNEEGAEPAISITLNNKGKGTSSSSQRFSRVAYHAPTKPVPFNFQTERREHDENRAADNHRESQSEKRLHSSTTIPNFKAMHAAQEAELALRKENIQPVVPLPIRWETDYRVKERQKFDERMREKEREQERLVELRRREREEQEEREVRELRKRAVPKAHEVPEWYKEAPKKKKDNGI